MKKKLVAWLTILMMLITTTGSISVFADTEIDRTPPVLNNIFIEGGENVTSETETVKVHVNFVEEGTGLNEIHVFFDNEYNDYYYWEGVQGDSYGDDAMYEEPVFTGTHSYDIWIQNHFEVGTHYITEVRLVDFNGNESVYTRDRHPWVFDSNAKLVVTEKKPPVVPTVPVISKFKITPTENIDASGKFTVEFTVDSMPEANYIWRLRFNLENLATGNVNYDFEMDFKRNEITTGTYKRTFAINNTLPVGQFKVESLSIGYESCEMDGDLLEIYAYEHPEIFENSILTVTKSTLNDKPLVLTNTYVSNKDLKAPNVLKLNMDFIANGNTPYWATVSFKTAYGKEIKFETLRMKGSGDHYYVEIPMSPFVAEGPLKLYMIYIEECQYKSDLKPEYYQWYYRDDYSCFENADFNLWTEYNISYFGSLGNSKALSNVKALKAGETAVLDCRISKKVPKEMFTAIAEKDITLALVDENVQWVFNGKDITKEKCKDINVSSSIEIVSGENYGFANDKKVALLKFRDNGELPGEVEMRINHEYLAVKYNFQKEDMKVTYLADNGNAFLEDSNVDVAGDEYYEYEVDHNSTFALSKNKAKIGKTTVSPKPYCLSVIKITWKKTLGNGYYVYRSTSKNGPYKKVKTITSRTKTSYIDYDVKTGKTYYYKVKPYSKNAAFNKTAKMSDVLKTNPRLGAPQLNSVKKVQGKRQIKVAWGTINWSNANQKHKYSVYRSTKQNGTYTKIATVTSKRSYIDKNVKSGKTYYYKVKAVHTKHPSWSGTFSNVRGCKL